MDEGQTEVLELGCILKCLPVRAIEPRLLRLKRGGVFRFHRRSTVSHQRFCVLAPKALKEPKSYTTVIPNQPYLRNLT